ncbi:MAG: transporter, partial [Microbacteriaceae bacterium]|nr:transporter [Microbacteriaceae bacterium]
GMIAATFPAGALIGPILGGVIVTYWSWRFVFFVNVPIGIALLILGIVVFPRSAPRVASPANRLDLHGVLLLGAFILSGMIGITSLGESGATVFSSAFFIPVVVSIVALVLFVRHAKYAPNPFIALDLLVGKTFGAMNALNFLFGACAFGFSALVPIYAHDRYGIPILAAGTLLTARAVGMILVTSATVFALRRIGYRIPMFAGFSIIVIGMLMLAIAPPAGVTPYLWLSIGGAVTGLGVGMTIPAANNAALMLSPSRISSIAGLRGMFRQSGGIVAVSIATTIAARSGNEGATLGVLFFCFAVVLFLAIPIILAVPRVKYQPMTR